MKTTPRRTANARRRFSRKHARLKGSVWDLSGMLVLHLGESPAGGFAAGLVLHDEREGGRDAGRVIDSLAWFLFDKRCSGRSRRLA